MKRNNRSGRDKHTHAERDSPTTNAGETITCLSCLALNTPAEAFCHECGAPIGRTATLDPINTIRAEGFLLRKSLEGRPKLITLLGIWIIHLPVLVLGVYSAVYIILKWRGLSAFLFFWALVGLACFAFVILYRITKNYLTIPKKE